METKHFKDHELRCSCGCGQNKMDAGFMEKLEELRETVGFKMYLLSAYRCPDYNVNVSSSGKTGPHTQGKAVDVLVSGEKAFNLLKQALALGFHGIGIRQTGPHEKRYIHLDIAEIEGLRPWVWSYESGQSVVS